MLFVDRSMFSFLMEVIRGLTGNPSEKNAEDH